MNDNANSVLTLKVITDVLFMQRLAFILRGNFARVLFLLDGELAYMVAFLTITIASSIGGNFLNWILYTDVAV